MVDCGGRRTSPIRNKESESGRCIGREISGPFRGAQLRAASSRGSGELKTGAAGLVQPIEGADLGDQEA